MYIFELLYIIPSRAKSDEDRKNKFLLIKSIVDLVDNGELDIDNDVLGLFDNIVDVAEAVSVDFPNALQELSDIGLYPEVIRYVYCDFSEENEMKETDDEFLVLPSPQPVNQGTSLNMMHVVCAAFSVLLLATPAVVTAVHSII